jgi:UrcA family protein
MSASFPIAAVLALTAASAIAQPTAVRQRFALDGQSIIAETTVPYQDLDLATPEGLRTLRQRIAAAADAVCGGEPTSADAYLRQAYLVCCDDAVRASVARLPAPAQARLATRQGGARQDLVR